MAKEIVQRSNSGLAGRSKEISQVKHKEVAKHAKKAVKKHAKKATKKHVTKAAKHVGQKAVALKGSGMGGEVLVAAFHHMQRASVVISLMEKGTGEDLRDLLARGVKLYEKALEGHSEETKALRVMGVLKATERNILRWRVCMWQDISTVRKPRPLTRSGRKN
jgi:poly(3-hydroxyalkanoate) synthetase